MNYRIVLVLILCFAIIGINAKATSTVHIPTEHASVSKPSQTGLLHISRAENATLKTSTTTNPKNTMPKPSSTSDNRTTATNPKSCNSKIQLFKVEAMLKPIDLKAKFDKLAAVETLKSTTLRSMPMTTGFLFADVNNPIADLLYPQASQTLITSTTIYTTLPKYATPSSNLPAVSTSLTSAVRGKIAYAATPSVNPRVPTAPCCGEDVLPQDVPSAPIPSTTLKATATATTPPTQPAIPDCCIPIGGVGASRLTTTTATSTSTYVVLGAGGTISTSSTRKVTTTTTATTTTSSIPDCFIPIADVGASTVTTTTTKSSTLKATTTAITTTMPSSIPDCCIPIGGVGASKLTTTTATSSSTYAILGAGGAISTSSTRKATST
ncbi:hypothetical protein SeMB42_g04478, partial [Synchytrium endobioticum]